MYVHSDALPSFVTEAHFLTVQDPAITMLTRLECHVQICKWDANRATDAWNLVYEQLPLLPRPLTQYDEAFVNVSHH